MEMKIPAGWYDLGMNWDNPDPSKIEYTVALLEAIKERSLASNIYMASYPYQYSTCHIAKGIIHNSEHIQQISRWIKILLNKCFIDMEYQDYKNPLAEFVSFDHFPKTISFRDFQNKYPDMNFYPPYHGASNQEVAEYYKACKTILSELRWTSASTAKMFSQESMIHCRKEFMYSNSFENNCSVVFKALQQAIKDNNFTNSGGDSYKSVFQYPIGAYAFNFSSRASYVIGFINYKVYFECTKLPNDFKPKLFAYILAEPQEKIGSSVPLISSTFWCEPFGIIEAKTTKLIELGDYIAGRLLSVGDLTKISPYPPELPYQNSFVCGTVYGAKIKLVSCFDWFTPGGFKFQA